MNLLITTNPSSVEKLSKTGTRFEVALSFESAFLRVRTKLYKNIIVDAKSAESYKILGDNVITLSDFLKNFSVYEKQKTRLLKQEIIAVMSVKGGVGKSSFIKKLLDSIPEEYKVLAIDLNFYDGGGDLSFVLNLPILPHIGMYLKKGGGKAALNECLCSYSKNVFVLQAPPKLHLIKDLQGQHIEEIIKIAKQEFDIIIFDLPVQKNEYTDVALQNSNKKVVVVSGLESEIERISQIKDIDVIVTSSKKVKSLLQGHKIVNYDSPLKIFQ